MKQNKTRIVVQHPDGTQRSLLSNTFRRPWKLVKIEPKVKRVREPDMDEITTHADELLPLALKYDDTVQCLLDRARVKFGANISINGLIFQIKTRGL